MRQRKETNSYSCIQEDKTDNEDTEMDLQSKTPLGTRPPDLGRGSKTLNCTNYEIC